VLSNALKISDKVTVEMEAVGDKIRLNFTHASSAQPRKLAATTCFCSLVQPDSAAIGINFPLAAAELLSRRIPPYWADGIARQNPWRLCFEELNAGHIEIRRGPRQTGDMGASPSKKRRE
jgi:hypothetical protein